MLTPLMLVILAVAIAASQQRRRYLQYLRLYHQQEDARREALRDGRVPPVQRLLIPVGPTRIKLVDWSDDDFLYFCRFSRAELVDLVAGLKLPPFFRAKNGTKEGAFVAVMMLCVRLADPSRLGLEALLFGRDVSQCSRIINLLIDYMFFTWARGLMKWNPALMTPERCELFAAAARMKGSVLDNICCLIDGTIRGIARPIDEQRQWFNGHKRKHAAKYQLVSSLDGLLVHLFPSVGRRGDMGILDSSGIIDIWREHLLGDNGRQMACFGDLGYGCLQGVLYCGFNASNDAIKNAFNDRMKVVRVCVEWAFGEIVTLWAQLDRKKEQKTGLRPIGRMYVVAAFLTNCLFCIRGGNKTATYFGLVPPTLTEYLESFEGIMAEWGEEDDRVAAAVADDDD
ncbi:hypothetical protein RQP46_010863 [Phenoliferia psychrophenolica]